MKNVVNHRKVFDVKSAFPIIDTLLINSYPNPIVTVMSLVSHPSEAQQDQDEVKLLYMCLDFHNANNVLIIADSAQTEYCSTFHFPCVRPSVTGVTSHISHIYKGINAMLIIRGPIKPCIF